MKTSITLLAVSIIAIVFLFLGCSKEEEKPKTCSSCPSGMYLAIDDPDGIGCVCCDHGKTPNPNNGYLCD